MSQLKYYVYVSKTKVDMLYSQMLASITDKMEAEVKLNLHLAEISFSKKQFSDDLYVKLNLVLDRLEEDGSIGEIGGPLEYFKGNLFMGWAQIYPGVLFFGGKLNDVFIGLGGSMSNLIGYKWDLEDVPTGISHTPWLVSLLYKEIKFLTPFDPVKTRYGKVEGGAVENTSEKEYEKRVLSATRVWAGDITEAPEKFNVGKFEFVAKVLRYSVNNPSGSDNKVLLGTPIYVARTD